MAALEDSNARASELRQVLRQIVRAVTGRTPPPPMRTRIVAVDGLGGAGKSTFAEQLASALGGCQIVHTDDFASWDNPIDWWPQLIEKVLEPLARGEPACFERARWTEQERGFATIVPARFLILEGVSASRAAFRPYLTYSIWIEAAADLRLRRGLERDGQPARAQWEQWMVTEDRYQEQERPHECADLVLSGEEDLWS